LDAVYCNTDISVLLIDRNDYLFAQTIIGGPFSPTLIKEDLSRLFPDDDIITSDLLARPPLMPYF
jgi:hypothetical protein